MKKTLYILLLVCVGIVLGTLVAELLSPVPWLSWLAFGLSFGLSSPLVLDLYVLTLTLGLTVKLNVSVIIFICISLYIGRKVFKLR